MRAHLSENKYLKLWCIYACACAQCNVKFIIFTRHEHWIQCYTKQTEENPIMRKKLGAFIIVKKKNFIHSFIHFINKRKIVIIMRFVRKTIIGWVVIAITYLYYDVEWFYSFLKCFEFISVFWSLACQKKINLGNR